MSILFEPMKIKDMALRNRFIRSATYDGSADKKGHTSDNQMKLFTELAEGGVGLIVTGITYVNHSGQISSFQNGITSDESIPSFRRLTDALHDRGAKIAVQLFHAGRERGRFIKSKKEKAIGPSYVGNDSYFSGEYRAINEDEIWEIIRAFGDAAKRAREAGFDAVQVHAAHAYLLSQFLSPYTNRRDDDWGGTPLENRLHFHREIYREIRAKVGEDYPVLIKIGVQDGFPEGLQFGEGRLAARLLAEWGFDALEISCGLRGRGYGHSEFQTNIDREDREGYFRAWSKEIKREVNVPVVLVGGLRTFQLMEKIIHEGEADFISLCRPLIKEPGIINEWKSGNHRRPTCISCNKCFEALLKIEPLHCVQKRKEEGNSSPQSRKVRKE